MSATRVVHFPCNSKNSDKNELEEHTCQYSGNVV